MSFHSDNFSRYSVKPQRKKAEGSSDDSDGASDEDDIEKQDQHHMRVWGDRAERAGRSKKADKGGL